MLQMRNWEKWGGKLIHQKLINFDSLAFSCSGLRIQCCHCFGHCCGLGLIPGPELPHVAGLAKKKSFLIDWLEHKVNYNEMNRESRGDERQRKLLQNYFYSLWKRMEKLGHRNNFKSGVENIWLLLCLLVCFHLFSILYDIHYGTGTLPSALKFVCMKSS